jgi:hypothetical protein
MQQPRELPQIVHPENEPKGRPKPSPEKSRFGKPPAALDREILLACHILPHFIIKFTRL